MSSMKRMRFRLEQCYLDKQRAEKGIANFNFLTDSAEDLLCWHKMKNELETAINNLIWNIEQEMLHGEDWVDEVDPKELERFLKEFKEKNKGA